MEERNFLVDEISNKSVRNNSPDASEIQAWIISYIAKLFKINQEQIEPTISFGRYGLDSSEVYALIGDLEDWLGREIKPTVTYDYPTAKALSEYLSSMNANQSGISQVDE